MKKMRRLLSLMLTLVCVFTILITDSVSVNAEEYFYRIKICLGNNADAYFDAAGVAELEKNYKVVPASTEVGSGTTELQIENLKFNECVTVDVDSLVKIKPNEQTGESKYYMAGLRVSGGDTIVTQTTKDAAGERNVTGNFKVTGDENYVVAYGVGAAISYQVKYVDEAGNDLMAADTYYAARGEIVQVPARHVDGYYPDAYYKTASKGLREDTVFTFIYKKYNGTTVTIDDTVYETTTEYGEPEYEYQYTPRTNQTTNGGTRTNRVNNIDNDGNGGATDGQNAADDQNQQAGVQFENGEGEDEDINADSQLPLDIIDIDDEEVAKAGGANDNLTRNMIIGIVIAVIAVLAVIATLVVASKKRKKAAVKVESTEKE
ncbi:MAG: hypothetical protein IJR96_02230 [Pseudobutyrivibrio sp.]|nr:hypothetical protein [Pseudobutyrivibrio sp.]